MTDVHQDKLKCVLQEIAKERGYADYELVVTPTFTGGANYSSQLYRGKITAPGQRDLKYFAKVASVSDKFREQMPTDIFFIERYTYRTLAGIFRKIQDDNDVPKEHRLTMPVLYGYAETKPYEIIVLEDLAAEGFTTHDRRVACEWPYTSAAVGQLAILHALSIAMQHNYPKEFEEVKKHLLFQSPGDDNPMRSMIEGMVHRSISLCKEENRERLRSYMTENMSKIMSLYFGNRQTFVLAHGDFRMSNTMHKVHKDGKCEVIIIDYQTIHLGSMAKDLMYFIFTGTDAKFRRRHYQQLLDHYYEQLSLALTRLHVDPNQAFSREYFDSEIKKNLTLGLFYAVFSLPVVMVEEKHIPSLGEDSGMENVLQVEITQLCQERLNGVVEDYIQWGIL